MQVLGFFCKCSWFAIGEESGICFLSTRRGQSGFPSKVVPVPRLSFAETARRKFPTRRGRSGREGALLSFEEGEGRVRKHFSESSCLKRKGFASEEIRHIRVQVDRAHDPRDAHEGGQAEAQEPPNRVPKGAWFIGPEETQDAGEEQGSS